MNPARAPGVTRPDDAQPGVAPRDGVQPEETGTGRGGVRGASLRSPATIVAAALVALLALPLVVALVVLHEPRTFPTLDMAMTEIRVRDVGTGDTPLIGLPGRIGGFGEQGSHPGPLSFWALAPVYRLLGATAWAMNVSMVVLQVGALALALWLARRRGGLVLVLGLGVVLALLARTYGAGTLTEPWNPHLPLLFWVVTLLAVWSVLCDDLTFLPVAVVTGSLCAQTHIPYLGLSGGIVAFAFAAAFVQAYRRRQDDPEGLGRYWRYALIALGVGVIVWLPPIVDQLTATRGNFSVIVEHFGDPPEEPVGLRRGVELVLIHLNPWRLVSGRVVTETPQTTTTGSWVPGLVFLAAWGGAVAGAWRLRLQSLLRLDLVLGVALVLATVSASRIFGFVWYYLLLWAWGITALMVLTVGWTAAVAVGRRLDDAARRRVLRAVPAALGAVVLVIVAIFAVDAADTERAVPRLSDTVGRVSAPTVDALESGSVAGGGRDGRYLVTWDDPNAIGSQGWGLLNELDRQGFDVGVPESYWPASTPDQRMRAEDATAEVHFVTGPGLGEWASRPGVERVAYLEPRTRAERTEYERLREEVIEELEAAGVPDVVENVDQNLLTAAAHPQTPKSTQEKIVRMINLGLPTAVFVGPAPTP
ncbi:MAG TPA: hypothetical protein VF152_07485 [Acidimicrobiia bacterium]